VGGDILKKNSLFSKILLLIVISMLCIILTVTFALLAGSSDKILFDLSKLNLYNAIPILIVGFFVSCCIVSIAMIFILRTIILKIKDYLNEKNGSD